MYSPFATLSDILFYTPTDGYNYLTDNRPIYQLDTNIRALAASLVGIGYGEHGSVSGDVLTPGKGVELLPNGSIRYPDSSTNPSTAILGLAIGSAGAGLTKVIWGSQLLDLDVLGLAGILVSSTAGQYIKVDTNITGNLLLVSSISDSDLILGRVKNTTCISIGKDGQNTVVADTASQKNYYTNFGVTRKRNLDLLSSVGATPLQFTKTITYQDDLGTTYNPLSIKYNSATGSITANDSVPGAVYGSDSNGWVLRETFTQFLNSDLTDAVKVSTFTSSWPAVSFPTLLEGGLPNYELQPIGPSGIDYTAQLATYKDFYITKYYQYARATSLSDPIYGKVTATVTVLDPKGLQKGGEQGKVIICDFMTYSLSGREASRNRIIVTGTAADTLYSDTTIFPSIIKA
jgi:hypothetical protein